MDDDHSFFRFLVQGSCLHWAYARMGFGGHARPKVQGPRFKDHFWVRKKAAWVLRKHMGLFRRLKG